MHIRTISVAKYPYPCPFKQGNYYPYRIRIRQNCGYPQNIYPRIHIRASLLQRKRCQLVFDDHCQTYGNLCQTAVKMPNHCTHPH